MTSEKEATTVGDYHHHQHEPQPPPPQYDGAASYPPQPQVALPAPPPHGADYPPPNYYPQVAEATQAPLRVEPLPCCGCGIGWFMFIIGFFLAGIPWYVGAIILGCVETIDDREKRGFIACTIAAVISTIAATIQGIVRAVA